MAYENIEELLKKEAKPWEYNFEFECDDEKYKALSTFERYFTYKISPEATAYDNANQFIKMHFGYNPISDPDGSGKDYYQIIHKIYNALWGWEKDRRSTFGTLKGNPDLCEFGADTMNSVQTALGLTIEPNRWGNRSLYWTLECWCCDKEKYEQIWKGKKANDYIDAYHTLGNFVLVPKWFNGDRGTMLYLCKNEEKPSYFQSKKDGKYYQKIDDFWDLSLEYLNENGFHKKIKKSEVNFDKEMFDWYINYFFLWDYVQLDKGSYKVNLIGMNEQTNKRDFPEFFKISTDLIKRRGKFMTAMLDIQHKKTDLYKEIQTFLTNKDKDFTAESIFDAAKKILENQELGKKITGNAKNLLVDLEEGKV